MTVEVERTERKPVEMRSPGAHAAPEVRRTEVAPPAAEGTAIGDRGGPESIGAAPARFRRIAWRASGVLALLRAPDLRPAQEEALIAGEAVDDFVFLAVER